MDSFCCAVSVELFLAMSDSGKRSSGPAAGVPANTRPGGSLTRDSDTLEGEEHEVT